jgi:hypothetical protein
MKPRQLFIRVLAVLFATPLAGTVAQGGIASDYFSCFQ